MKVGVSRENRGQLRILHVVSSLNRGGIETWLTQALPHVDSASYVNDICTYRTRGGTYAESLAAFGARIHFVSMQRNVLSALRFARDFRRLLGRERYDVVHSHGFLLVGFMLMLAWSAGVPVRIAHCHNTNRTDTPSTSLTGRIALFFACLMIRRFCTRGVACSEKAATVLFGRNWVKDPRFQILHCGIDLTPFREGSDSKPLRARLGLPEDATVIGHVGSFTKAKNHLFLVKVAAEAFQMRDGVRLVLVGDGPLRTAVAAEVERLGIADRVTFTGVVGNVPDYLTQVFDLFLMPSLHEGLPLALLEAQAAGLPALVSDAVSDEGVVDRDRVHFLPLSAGPVEWACRALECLEKTPRKSSLGLKQLETSDFNIKVSASRLESLYSESIGELA